MPAHEFAQWETFHQIFPLGDERSDWRIGQLAALLYNINRGKNEKPAKTADFMLKPPETIKQREAQLRARLRGMNRK